MKKTAGFTIIELMIVIAIVGIVAAIFFGPTKQGAELDQQPARVY